MPAYDIQVPERNSIDALAEAREQRDQRTRARMNKKLFLDDILVRLMDEMLDQHSPLGELVDMLWSAPARDIYDLRSVCEMRDGRRLGNALVKLVAEASLSAYQDADAIEGF